MFIVTYPSNVSFTNNTSNEISYNQPNFDSQTVWSPTGVLIANLTNPYGIFINKNDTIYAVDVANQSVSIWLNGSLNPAETISLNLTNPFAIFVTSSIVASASSYGVFVDLNNTLYFSVRDQHKVLSRSLRSTSNVLTLVAGTGCTNILNQPHGIFVDTNFDLYVADAMNNRIQLFRFGEQNGITVVGGNGLLNFPNYVTLDFDKNLFIIDRGNVRVVMSGSNGFRCVLGCSSLIDNQFLLPTSMTFDSQGNIYLVDENTNTIRKFIRLNNTALVPSYNQPRFASNATWDQNATTVANQNQIGRLPFALFIDTNNSIYTVNRDNGRILIWMSNSNDPNLILYTQLSTLAVSIFVTINRQIYVADSTSIKQIIKSNQTISIATVSSIYFYGLFVDLNNTLYCSIYGQHKVVKKSLNDSSSAMKTVAGNGTQGSASNLLQGPYGIFVDTNFDLYVADCGNNRIQLFHLGQTDGITVAGDTSENLTISLYYPTNVILDGNKYLFITDYGNHRIIGSDENGFRCIVACSMSSGSTSNQLSNPQSIAFDSFGNLFVVDNNNNRIQKFRLLSNISNSKIKKTNDSIFSFDYLGETTTTTASSLSLVVPTCANKTTMGTNCNISSTPCDLLKPCKNYGTCENRDEGYVCNCLKDFDGSECEIDNRRCKPTTCWNQGKCNETTGECSCEEGWTGDFCEKMINYCANVTCENNAPCRSSFLNFTCECLTENYSGRYCEIVSTKLVTLQFVSKSFGYIAIIFLLIVISFVVIMDVLKYGFGIDPAKHELERIRREKAGKRKHRPVIQRFHYVN